MVRYSEDEGIISSLNPLDDLLCFLEYLTSEGYLKDVLRKIHGLSGESVTKRAKKIIPHAEISIGYFRESLASRPDLAFLLAYYGILNLAKVYILLGPRHSELPAHRLHGVSYPVDKKDSHSVLTETLKLQERGVFPLFYETLTKRRLPALKRIQMRDVYPFVNNIGAEYLLATGEQNSIRTFRVGDRPHRKRKGHRAFTATLMRMPEDKRLYKPGDFKALLQFRRDESSPDCFVGRVFRAGTPLYDPIKLAQFNQAMVYDSLSDVGEFTTPVCSRRLLMPEEIPIFLLFFHMSSVVRYKPEFLQRTRQSRYWPMLLAARRHCVLRMLILTWSFVHRRNLVLKHDVSP